MLIIVVPVPVPPVASLSRDLPVADVHDSSEMDEELSSVAPELAMSVNY